METPTVPTDQDKQATELKTKIDSLTTLLEGQKAASDSRAAETEKQLANLYGRLSVMAPQAPEVVEEPLTSEVLLNEPQKILDAHWEKRAKPLIDANIAASAITQREILTLKRKGDWDKYGKEVDEIAGRLTPSILSAPGTYEGVLDVVKSRHIDAIVAEQVKAEVAKFQSDAARTATASSPAPASPSQPVVDEIKFEDSQLAVLAKFGVDPKRAAEIAKNTVFDGIRITGPVQ